MAMAKVLAVASQKGGVGKTTTVVNLAASLALIHDKVLVVDMDPQGNATMGCGVDKLSLKKTIKEPLLQECSLKESIVTTDMGFDIVGANRQLTVAEVSLLSAQGREKRLQEQLGTVWEDYDCIIIDCPPTLSLLTINALMAAQGVIIPVQCEYYALEGLTELLRTITQLHPLNPQLCVAGALKTMYDGRNKLTIEVAKQLEKYFGKTLVYKTVIPRNVRLAESPSHGMPTLYYDRGSQGAKAYLALAAEILDISYFKMLRLAYKKARHYKKKKDGN